MINPNSFGAYDKDFIPQAVEVKTHSDCVGWSVEKKQAIYIGIFQSVLLIAGLLVAACSQHMNSAASKNHEQSNQAQMELKKILSDTDKLNNSIAQGVRPRTGSDVALPPQIGYKPSL